LVKIRQPLRGLSKKLLEPKVLEVVVR
jgi:hypothetical protein